MDTEHKPTTVDKKKAYFVSYDIRGSDARMTGELAQMGAMKVLRSAWVLCSLLSADAIMRKLGQHVPGGGGIFVLSVGYGASFASPIANKADIQAFLTACDD